MRQLTCFLGRATTVLLVSALSSIHSSGAADTTTEQAIFRTLLAFPDRPSRMVVVDATPLPLVHPSASQWEWVGDPAAAALKPQLDVAMVLKVEEFSSASFPPATTLVPHAELPLQGTRTGWAEFVERSGSRDILRFSRPLISTDRRHALVYRVQARGPQDGRTDLFLLQRRVGSEEWAIVKQLPLAIS